jgi:transposase
MGRKVHTDEAAVIHRLNSGDRQRDIADAIGVSRQWVALFAKKNGLNRPKAGRPSRYNHEKILEMLRAGSSYSDVAKAVNAPSESAVRAAVGYRRRKGN